MVEDEQADAQAKPEKLAIGVPGGFDVGGKPERFEDEHSLAVLPGGALVPLPCPELPEQVLNAITAIQVS